MGGFSGKIDVDKLLSFSDDLVSVLKEKRDMNILNQSLHQFKALRLSCDAGYNDSRSLLEDYQKKIDECKQKAEKAKLEVSADDELDPLQKELEQEREKEFLLMEELRVINSEINDLERRRILVEEQKQSLKKHEQEELREQRKLSMYASVTTIIPNLDEYSKISGHIVDRNKRKVEKFEFDPTNMTTFDTCQSIWKMINL
ncbi:kinetochore protein SPC24 homolog [Euphorbia lathyris]|uniref:kinetochore protein SPC24 homolog n=1 Tax=Euphorbia lathyris TaxID=212925 RepID=UPI0033142703